MRKLLIGLVVVCAVLAACGGGDDADPIADKGDPTTTAAAGQPTTTTTEAAPAATCTYAGTEGIIGETMHVDLTWTNPLGGKSNDTEVIYALLDGSGTRFFTGNAGEIDPQIMFPATDEQFHLLVDTREDLPASIDPATITCKVLGIDKGTDIGGFERATDASTCAVTSINNDQLAVVDVSAVSPYKTTTKVQVWWALVGPGGVRFDTPTKVVDLVGAGETFRVTGETGLVEVPDWVGDAPVTCRVVGFWDQGS
jgi:hypothetical protein